MRVFAALLSLACTAFVCVAVVVSALLFCCVWSTHAAADANSAGLVWQRAKSARGWRLAVQTEPSIRTPLAPKGRWPRPRRRAQEQGAA